MVGHNKDVCIMGMDEQNTNMHSNVQSEEVQCDAKSVTFGPWMQVSYARSGRNNLGSAYTGKRNGYIANSRRASIDTKHGNGTSRNGAEKLVKDVEIRKECGKGVESSGPKKVMAFSKGVKFGAKKVRGSRFSILL